MVQSPSCFLTASTFAALRSRLVAERIEIEWTLGGLRESVDNDF